MHRKLYEEFRGLDLRSSAVALRPGYSREFKNVMHTDNGGLSLPRFGWQYRAFGSNGVSPLQISIGLYGLYSYEAQDLLQNSKTELLACGSQGSIAGLLEFPLWRRTDYVSTVTNSNAAETTLFVASDGSQFFVTIIRSGVTLLNLAIGTVAGVSLSTLQTAVNGVSGLVMAIAAGTTGLSSTQLLAGEYVMAGSGGVASIPYHNFSPINIPRFHWYILPAKVDVVNDTIDLSYDTLAGDRFANPFKNGDIVQFIEGTGGTLPVPLSVGVNYTVLSATKSTIQVEDGFGTVDLINTGTSPYAIISPRFNPGATFKNYEIEDGTAAFQPVSSVQVRNNRYFSSGRIVANTAGSLEYRDSAAMTKYDSQSFYRAGMPKLQKFAGALGVATAAFTDEKGSTTRTGFYPGTIGVVMPFTYQFQAIAVDKTGNIITGTISPPVPAGISTVTANVLLQVIGTLSEASLISRLGFNSNYALADGSSGTLIPCTDGYGGPPNMDVGDIAYFWDERQDRYIQREVTEVNPASIRVAAISLDTNRLSPNFDDARSPFLNAGSAISANVRIAIWRTTSVGSSFFLVDEIPWSPIYTIYYDDKPDDQLGAAYVPPAYNGDLPPPCRYLAKLNDQVVAFGNESRDRTMYFEDIETPEGFPAGTHELDLPKRATAAAQSGPFLICTTRDSLHEVSGDLSEFKIRVDQIGHNVGCTSHFSMHEVEEGVLFFQSALGPYSLTSGRRLNPIGMIQAADGKVSGVLEPYFTRIYPRLPASIYPVFERAWSVVIPDRRWFVLFIPSESSTEVSRAIKSSTVGSGSLAFVYDYGRNAWYRWTNVPFSFMACFENKLHFVSRTAQSGVLDSRYGNMLVTQGEFNYADHQQAISVDWQSHWEALGRPAIFKKFLRLRISSYETRDAPSCQFDMNTFVDYDMAKQGTDDTLTFTTQTDLKPKLKSEAVRSLLVQFTGSRLYEPVPVSGFELEAVAPYREEFKE